MNRNAEPEALAALSICESILLSLTDNNIIDEAEMRAILKDAMAAHDEASAAAPEGSRTGHELAARLIEGIMNGGNSVRRGPRNP